MAMFASRLVLGSAVLALGVSAAACNKQPAIPTPTLKTETKTGTVSPGGSDSKGFTVEYAFSATDGVLTLKTLTSVATGAAVTVKIGLAFGAPAFDGTCQRAPQFTINEAEVGRAYSTNGALPFAAGNYCIVVFDTGTQLASVGAVNYTVEIQHY